jgi:hypothetical protein
MMRQTTQQKSWKLSMHEHARWPKQYRLKQVCALLMLRPCGRMKIISASLLKCEVVFSIARQER